jgi:DNA-binding transcriptional regulator LsrR (DeoR family)
MPNRSSTTQEGRAAPGRRSGLKLDGDTLRRVARWYYKEHLNKKQIAERLGLPNPEDQRPINAALEEIERANLVRIDIPETLTDCGPANDLKERFPHLKEIITVPWYDREEYADLLRRWGVAAAIYFEGLVKRKGAHHIGITGGETLF